MNVLEEATENIDKAKEEICDLQNRILRLVSMEYNPRNTETRNGIISRRKIYAYERIRKLRVIINSLNVLKITVSTIEELEVSYLPKKMRFGN